MLCNATLFTNKCVLVVSPVVLERVYFMLTYGSIGASNVINMSMSLAKSKLRPLMSSNALRDKTQSCSKHNVSNNMAMHSTYTHSWRSSPPSSAMWINQTEACINTSGPADAPQTSLIARNTWEFQSYLAAGSSTSYLGRKGSPY